ncbi:MAG: hypothetical protein LBS60_09290 [Deltaproteobacteria bacterium]|jgi:hypothetical protein|nr:hypothetical protein [Deltaproteobacteria bacterium]
MRKLNTVEDELNRIRVEIYEETKSMTTEELVEYFRKYGEEAAKKYGFTVAKPLNSKCSNQNHTK